MILTYVFKHSASKSIKNYVTNITITTTAMSTIIKRKYLSILVHRQFDGSRGWPGHYLHCLQSLLVSSKNVRPLHTAPSTGCFNNGIQVRGIKYLSPVLWPSLKMSNMHMPLCFADGIVFSSKN